MTNKLPKETLLVVGNPGGIDYGKLGQGEYAIFRTPTYEEAAQILEAEKIDRILIVNPHLPYQGNGDNDDGVCALVTEAFEKEAKIHIMGATSELREKLGQLENISFDLSTL